MGEAKRRGKREGEKQPPAVKLSQAERIKGRIERLPDDLAVDVYGTFEPDCFFEDGAYFKIRLDKDAIMSTLEHSLKARESCGERTPIELDCKWSTQPTIDIDFELVAAVDHSQASIVAHGFDNDMGENVSERMALGDLLKSLGRGLFDEGEPMTVWFGSSESIDEELLKVFNAMYAFGEIPDEPLDKESLKRIREACSL